MRKFLIVPAIFLFLFACNNEQKSATVKDQSKQEAADPIAMRIDSLSKEIRKTPMKDTLFFQRSRLYVQIGDFANAVNDLEIAKKLNKEEPQYYLDLAELEMGQGEGRISLELLQRAKEKFPENVTVKIKLARLLMAMEQFKDARTQLVLASRIEPRNPELYLMSSMIFQQIGEFDKAIEDLQKAVMYDPQYYQGHAMLGYINAQLGNKLAIDHYENAIRLQPDNPEAVYNLAMFYQENEMYDKALEMYRKGLEQINPDMQHFLFNTAYVYENFKNNPDTAITLYQKVIDRFPEDYRAFYRIGLCYEELGRPKEAMAQYDMSLKIYPKFEEAYNALSRLSEERKGK
ncbi:MAG: tetratricopeptide repeat protein [Salinivirgaceae bacterium]|jgi:tetratricopeptide (TPR) repeat protein|nr:tetratricopeptide repeat protein [Salinivirgaceae bacterium]